MDVVIFTVIVIFIVIFIVIVIVIILGEFWLFNLVTRVQRC